MSSHTIDKLQEMLQELKREPEQDSHLLLLNRGPVEGEEGWWGRGEADEGQGGTGGRVESVGACLRNSANTEGESKETESKSSQRHWKKYENIKIKSEEKEQGSGK